MKEVYDFLKKWKLEENENVVVAVSGGPDSMALLHLLIKLKEEKKINIICAHVNHNLRKESREEKIFVENYCKKNNVLFEYRKIEKYPNNKFKEETARQKRYEYFEEIINKYSAKYLYTAHHGDDLIETMLMRMVRGSTLRGYSGFSKVTKRKNYQIIRPFITITKEDIITYNKENNIPYVIDKTNEKDTYTRNRYRKYITPFLKKENINVHHKFYKMSEMLLEYDYFIKKYAKEAFQNIYREDILNIPLYLKEDKIIQKEILYTLLEHIYEKDLWKITDKHIKLIEKIIYSKKPNVKITFPNHIEIRKSYDKLIIEKGKKKEEIYKIELKEKVVLEDGHRIEKVKETEENSNFICRLKKEDITLPLFVRTRKKGDKVEVKGLNGRKKLKDIFIDEKIDIEKRKTYPVVVDALDTIVWLPGLKKTKLDKPKEGIYDIILKYY